VRVPYLSRHVDRLEGPILDEVLDGERQTAVNRRKHAEFTSRGPHSILLQVNAGRFKATPARIVPPFSADPLASMSAFACGHGFQRMSANAGHEERRAMAVIR
jgi:hypothetical protein